MIIPATILKRAGQGKLPYFGFIERVREEVAAGATRPPPGEEPLGPDIAAVEQARKIVAWSADLLVQRNLKELASRQQHLEILSNMVIDLFAAESVVARTRKLVDTEGEEAAANELDITRIFVASANERIADGARRLAANELHGDELRAAFAAIEGLAIFLPIATIDAKTRIAERIEAGNLRFSE